MRPAQATVFILDDDRTFARNAADLVSARGMRPLIAHSLAESMPLVARHDMDLLLLDHLLPDGTAFELIDALDFARHGQVALVTGHPDLRTAARAVSSPVIDYVIKPFRPERLNALLDGAAERAAARGDRRPGCGRMIGASPPMLALCDAIARIAPAAASVLVTGERGTGKAVAARALHDGSGRDGAFVAVDCAAAPDVLAARLFGHARDAVIGARGPVTGALAQARGGTLFLDRITAMPRALQAVLLHALDSGHPVVANAPGEDGPGAHGPDAHAPDAGAAQARIVAATDRDPSRAIHDGHLCEDLYHRVADVVLEVAPLRHRGRDVVLLAEHAVQGLNARCGGDKRLAPGSEQALMAHPWPGNVRELRGTVQRAYRMTAGDRIIVRPAAAPAPTMVDTHDTITFAIGMTFAQMQAQALRKTLAYHGNDKSATARALGVSVRTIHNHLERARRDGDGS